MNYSFLISVYKNDCPKAFNLALESLEAQTVKPSAIILCVDGPVTIPLEKIILEKKKNHLYTIKHITTNVGLAKALNQGLKLCTTDIVLRADADDISLPHRAELQLKEFIKDPELVALSSYVKESNKSIRKVPLEYRDIIKFTKLRSPLNHPSSAFRLQSILSLGGYPEFRRGQDYALWSLIISKGMKLKNIPDVLVTMGGDENLMKRRGLTQLKNELLIIKFQREIKLITFTESILSYLVRTIVRLSPEPIRSELYKITRK